MSNRTLRAAGPALAGAACAAALAISIAAAAPQEQSHDHDGWQVPPSAAAEKNPMRPATPQVLAAGRALFRKNCQRCHGPKGVGDGPDAEPEYMADMDLTNPSRAGENPDGVVFFKVWNGRQNPKMPAFKNELTRDQVWTIVTYVQTLRGTKAEKGAGR